ncbi:Ureidoglycine aminohydrolase [Morella rubra]|uniref:Ureidoglycine aminohydrolase n=1 Tax=Morella rubra TaxID=262757 RepID=A0A6A1VUG2_9ROSI|nr:Ureidoglycine aminohydrolase [Morella rubra]
MALAGDKYPTPETFPRQSASTITGSTAFLVPSQPFVFFLLLTTVTQESQTNTSEWNKTSTKKYNPPYKSPQYTDLTMQTPSPFLLFLLSTTSLLHVAVSLEGFCSTPYSIVNSDSDSKPLYWKVTNPTLSPSSLEDLPGFTRSVYKKDHALITPESHVSSPLPEWTNTLGAYLIAPAMGSHFVMYLAKMQENSKSGLPPFDIERFIFVVQGAVTLSNVSGVSHKLIVDSYAYLPPSFQHSLKCDASATLVVFERRYASMENYVTEPIISSTEKQPLLETPGEVFELRKLLPTSFQYDFNIHVFELRKLLPTSFQYDFNIHIMDFQPGEFLNVKEVHYNQHGLLLLEGQGIYRLGDSWYPVEAGDVIWMAPFVPQWYAALGKTRSRYLLYKDVNRNPL